MVVHRFGGGGGGGGWKRGEIVMLRGMTVKGGKHRQVSETMVPKL